MVENRQNETATKKMGCKKSRRYPFYDINVALQFSAVVEKLGGHNVSEGILLNELGIKIANTRSFAGKISSAKYFGLIIVEGKTYTLTDKAMLILKPKDEGSKKNLLREAFLTPDIYKELYEKFQEKQIPPVDTLANILFHDYGIKMNVREDAARAFIDSARYVGLLGADNVLRGSKKDVEPVSSNEDKAVGTLTQTSNIPAIVTATIKLSKGTASIILPEGGIDKKDNERLQKLIDAYVIEDTES